MKNLLHSIGKIPSKLKYFTYLLAVFSLLVIPTNEAYSQITYSISKSNNAPTPIKSGQPFTYTITYNWSGGAPGTLYIKDIVPASLDVLSALPISPISSIVGNTVNFAITGLTNPSGSGTVQINARFKPGVTCEGVEACNVAQITNDLKTDKWIESNSTCVISDKPENKWQLKKEKIAGCAIDDEVVYRICITSPSGSDIGGLNLYIDSFEDLLPAGAEIIDVNGSWTGPDGVTSTGTWIGLTGGPVALNVSPYPIWYCAYIKVKYPSPTFSVGNSVKNIAKLTYHTACDDEPKIWTDTVSTVLCEGVSIGVLNKYFAYNIYFNNNPYWYPTFAPNCCGEYRLWYRNLGTIAQGPVIIEDTLSGDVDINKIQTDIPNNIAILPVTVEVYTWNGSSCNTVPAATFTYTTVGAKVESTLPADICRIKWTYDTIPVNTIVREYLDVCARTTNFKTGIPLTPGYIANNPMAVHADTLHLFDEVDTPVDTTSPNVIAVKLFTGECDNGAINPNGPFMPGDTVRYRLAVANVGNLDATLASITDNLPAGFTYVGNESYFYGSFNYSVNAYNPNCNLFSATVPSQIGGSITSPSVGDNSLLWSFPVLPANCDGSVEFFLIEFDVALSEDPPVLAGQHQNTFDFDASNSPVITSNVAFMTVNAIAQLQTKKEVRLKGSGNAWANIANIPQGQTAEYKLSVINTGNTPLTQICLLDIAPWVGDISVLPPYSPRNSQFDLPYNPADGAITITPAGFTTTYNTSTVGIQKNPSRTNECGGFCGIADPVGALAGTWGSSANTYSYKVNANSGVSLAAGATLEILVPSTIPSATAVNDTACNSFAIQSVPAGLPNVCLSTESNKACVVAKEKEDEPCLIVERVLVDCKKVDADGNQIYGLTLLLQSNLTYTTTVNLTSTNANFFNLAPITLPPATMTTILSDFTSSASAGDTVCFIIELKDKEQRTVCKKEVCIVIPDCSDDDCLILERARVDCKGLDQKGNQIYGLNLLLQSNLTSSATITFNSTNASFSNITPTTLPPATMTTVLADFITTASVGDTVCFVVVLNDAAGNTVCKKEICIVIPDCKKDDDCKCPFDINVKPLEAGQSQGTSFFMSNGIYTSGASLKRVRATIISAVITEECEGKITIYNSGATFVDASAWTGNNATGLGTSSVTWDSKDCDPLDEFLPEYKLDIPFTSAEKCKLKVKLCIRYEFLDCECFHCETVLCTEFEVKNPISGIAREDGLSKRTISSTVYPNPISSMLNIDYSLKQSSNVSIVIRDLTGKAVATLVNSEQKIAGDYTITMETFNLPAGVYLYTIETESESHTNRFVIKK